MRSRLLISSLFLVVAGASILGLQQPSSAQGARFLQMAIPGYIFSDDLRSWEQIADRAASIPIVVVNPRNGPNVYAGTRCDGFTPPNDPGTGPNLSGLRMDDLFVSTRFPSDPKLVTSQLNYLATLEQHFIRRSSVLASAGIGMYGYVWSNTNGADPGCPRSLGIIGDEIDLYKRAYGITNIFFDDASGSCPNDKLRSMTDLARSKGARVIVNVGSPAASCLATQADVVVNFEGTSASYLASKDALIANASVLRSANPNIKLWHILYGVVDADVAAVIAQVTTSADYLYITDDTTQAHGCDRGNSNFDALYGTWPIIRQDIPACASRANGSSTSFSAVVTAISKSELPISGGTGGAAGGGVIITPAATAAQSTTAPLTFAPIVTTSTSAPVLLAPPVISSATTTSTTAALASTSTTAALALGNTGATSTTPTTTSSPLSKTTSNISNTAAPKSTPSVSTTTKKPLVRKVTTIKVVVQKKIAPTKSVKKPVIRKPVRKVVPRK
jgi:Spherulation-specific family 4